MVSESGHLPNIYNKDHCISSWNARKWKMLSLDFSNNPNTTPFKYYNGPDMNINKRKRRKKHQANNFLKNVLPTRAIVTQISYYLLFLTTLHDSWELIFKQLLILHSVPLFFAYKSIKYIVHIDSQYFFITWSWFCKFSFSLSICQSYENGIGMNQFELKNRMYEWGIYEINVTSWTTKSFLADNVINCYGIGVPFHLSDTCLSLL